MTITRDGKTYELTNYELYAAYLEQRGRFDVASVCNELEGRLDEENLAPLVKLALSNPALLQTCAEMARDQLDYYGGSYRSAVENAADYALEIVAEEVAE